MITKADRLLADSAEEQSTTYANISHAHGQKCSSRPRTCSANLKGPEHRDTHIRSWFMPASRMQLATNRRRRHHSAVELRPTLEHDDMD